MAFSFHFVLTILESNENSGIGVFPQMHTKQNLCEFQILILLVNVEMCLSMGGLGKIRKILRAPNIELHLIELSSMPVGQGFSTTMTE